MGADKIPHRNPEGYADPTAHGVPSPASYRPKKRRISGACC